MTYPTDWLRVSEDVMFNGLRVVYRQTDQHIPTVVNVVCYRHDAYTARDKVLAAVVERYVASDIKKRISAIEKRLYLGVKNPTPENSSCFASLIPRNLFSAWLSLEKERMNNITFSQSGLATIKAVVQRDLVEERRDPEHSVRNTISVFFDKSFPLVTDRLIALNQVNLASVRDFYRRTYAPNNSTFIFGGGIDEDTVRRLMARIFGGVNSTSATKNAGATDRPDAGQFPEAGIRVHKIANLALPTIILQWPAYTLIQEGNFNNRIAAMLVLESVLSNPDFGVLNGNNFFSGRDVLAYNTDYRRDFHFAQPKDRMFELRFTLDLDRFTDSTQAIEFTDDFKEVFNLHLIHDITADKLRSAKHSLVNHFLSQDTDQARPILDLLPYTLATGIGTESLTTILDTINDISLEDLWSIANFMLFTDPYAFIFFPD